jgi:uncharacterized membrane protein YdbT with pleckstrin-like domain
LEESSDGEQDTSSGCAEDDSEQEDEEDRKQAEERKRLAKQEEEDREAKEKAEQVRKYDWNNRFQRVLAKLQLSRTAQSDHPIRDNVAANLDLLHLSQDFIHAAKTYGKIVISEGMSGCVVYVVVVLCVCVCVCVFCFFFCFFFCVCSVVYTALRYHSYSSLCLL